MYNLIDCLRLLADKMPGKFKIDKYGDFIIDDGVTPDCKLKHYPLHLPLSQDACDEIAAEIGVVINVDIEPEMRLGDEHPYRLTSYIWQNYTCTMVYSTWNCWTENGSIPELKRTAAQQSLCAAIQHLYGEKK